MKNHYYIVIVICCFLIAFSNMGLTSTSFNVYQSYIVEIPGVGDVGGSLIVTLRVCAAFVCMFFANRYYASIDARIGVTIASLFTIAGFAVYTFAENLVGFCIAAALTGVAYGMGGMVAATLIIGNWFKDHLGTAIGWASVGSGVASFVVPLIATQIIQNSSLQTAFIVDGLCALVLTLFVFLFVRSNPSQLGLTPFQGRENLSANTVENLPSTVENSVDDPSNTSDSHGITPVSTVENLDSTVEFSSDVNVLEVKEPVTSAEIEELEAIEEELPLKTPLPRVLYGAMLLALLFLGADCMVGMAFLGILFTSEGIDPLFMALLLSISGICLTCSKLIIGLVCDRFGTVLGSSIFYALLIIGLFLCCLVGGGGFIDAAIAAILFGIGTALASTGVSLWSLELSTEADRLKTIRSFQAAFLLGGFLFNMMPGPLKVASGSYITSYVILTAMAVLSAIIVISVCYSRKLTRHGVVEKTS